MDTWKCPGCGKNNDVNSVDEDLGHHDEYVWICSYCDRGWSFPGDKSVEYVFGK